LVRIASSAGAIDSNQQVFRRDCALEAARTQGHSNRAAKTWQKLDCPWIKKL
jgi:hypothetical protein